MSRAAATRWFDAHLGATIETVQRTPDGRVWAPGLRTLGKRAGWAGWVLDGSNVRLDPRHKLVSLTDYGLVIAWHSDDGTLIHTTTYTVVEGPRDGIDRCDCGCKYWQDGRCIDCGDR